MATSEELLQKFNNTLLNIYDKIEEKGGEAPDNKNLENVVSAVESITGGGGGDYDVPYFDGGQYGAIAYLDANGQLAYYTAQTKGELDVAGLSSGDTPLDRAYTPVVTIGDAVVARHQVVAFSLGTDYSQSPSSTAFLSYFLNLRRVYGLERWTGTTIGTQFMFYCISFSAPLDFSEKVVTVGANFMNYCRLFNQPLPFISNIVTIQNGFLLGCTSFNQPLQFSERTTSIGAYFLDGCSSYNQSLGLDYVTNIGDYFLRNCTSFNQPLVFSEELKGLGNSFLYQCTSFNSPITFRSSSVGSSSLLSFMYGCTSFNQPLALPLSTSTATTVYQSMLQGCTSFNSPLTLPETAQRIGDNFLRGCTAFAQNFKLPDTVTNVGNYFMYECNNFTGVLDVGKSSGIYSSSYMLSTTTSSAPMYVEGVKIMGENAEAWKMGLSDRTSSPYRKLIVVEEPYAILYTPGSGVAEDWFSDANEIRNVCLGPAYELPNTHNHTHLKFTERCQELTDITSFGNGFAPTSDIEVLEGLENFTAVTEIGYSMYNTRNAKLVSVTSFPPNLVNLGSNFCGNSARLNSLAEFPSTLKTIDHNFLAGCTNFSGPITIPASVEKVGYDFMEDTYYFRGPLTINTTAVPTVDEFAREDRSLSYQINSTVAYNAGVQLFGHGAQAWVNALPNSDVSPQRKLVIAEE